MLHNREEPLVIAVDFDGCIAHTDFPHIIAENKKVTDFMRRVKRSGGIIILYTCREGEFLDDALEFMRYHNIPWDYANENADVLLEKWGRDTRKLGFDYFLDDKAYNVSDVDKLEEIIFGGKKN